VKALVWYGDRSISYEDAPEPAPGDDEVVLDGILRIAPKAKASGRLVVLRL